MSGSASSIRKNKALFAFRQVQPISAVLAGALFELLVKVFVIVGIVILMYFMGMDLNIDNPILFLICFFCMWIFAVSLGLIFGIAELFVKEISKVRELLTRPLFFISGVFFSLQDFPREYWHFLDWNPILHAIELTRYSVSSTYGHEGVSIGFLMFNMLAFCFFSLSIYSIAWKQAVSR